MISRSVKVEKKRVVVVVKPLVSNEGRHVLTSILLSLEYEVTASGNRTVGHG